MHANKASIKEKKNLQKPNLIKFSAEKHNI